MRAIAIIITFVIFGQSLSVCAPAIYHLSKKSDVTFCRVDYSNEQEIPKCCKKSANSQDDSHHSKDSDDHDCCGDNCKCLCCVKVFIKELPHDRNLNPIVKVVVVKSIFPVFFHSFDYHSDSFHPPQLA